MTEVVAPEAGISGTQTVELDVKGMSCGACARRVENTLNKIDGVRASVDFGNRVAIIETDRDISVSDLCDAVQKAGYGANVRSDSTAESTDPGIRRKPSALRTAIATATLFVHWLISWLHH